MAGATPACAGAGTGVAAGAGAGAGVGAAGTAVAAGVGPASTVYGIVIVLLLVAPVAVTSYAAGASAGITKGRLKSPFVSATCEPRLAPLNQIWTSSPGWKEDPEMVIEVPGVACGAENVRAAAPCLMVKAVVALRPLLRPVARTAY